jgi:hypothetical protein
MRRASGTRWPSELLTLALIAGCAGADPGLLQDVLGAAGLEAVAPLDEPTIVAGLKEALRVGTDRTVASTSRENGYFGNPLIRLPLPDELEKAGDALRAVGFGGQVDQLELSMNRAAERAASEATPVFVDAIRQMTFADARSILTGGERAATDYFESHTRTELGNRFSPIVDRGMQEVGLVRLYDGVVSRIEMLPLVPRPELDLRSYVTERALDGLFAVLAQEEGRIREDPAARTTELLRTVFGR